MKVLLVGAGGVGSAFVKIAARRDFIESLVVGDIDAGRAPRRLRPRSATGPRAWRWTRRTRRAVEAVLRAEGMHGPHERGGPPVRDAAVRRRLRRRRRLRGHGDVAVAAAPRAPYEEMRREAGRRAVRRGRGVGGRRAGSRWWAWASSPGSRTCSPATPPTCCSTTSTRSGIRDGANLAVAGYDFAPTFSIWTTIEECLNPPVIWEAGSGLVHHRAVQRRRGVRLPRGHRAGRVRQRRARGGAARPALGQLQARHLQVRAGRRVHRRAPHAPQARASTAPRRCR